MIYAALFEASSAALRALAANPRFVGTDRLGFFGVLHTWGRTLEYPYAKLKARSPEV